MNTSLNRLRKVALIGFYGHGNFGDDWMAILFGNHLQQAGIPFTVYRLPPYYARQFGFDATDSMEELLEDCQALLWCGGGLLVSWSQSMYKLLFRNYAQEYETLIQMALKRKVKLGAFSVGGNGSCHSPLTPSYKQIFLENAQYISVRNPQDLDLLRQFNIPGAYFPDVVWQTQKHFTPQVRSSPRLRIGIDLYWSILLRQNALYAVPLLYFITQIRSDCDFIFIDTTNQMNTPYRAVGKHWPGKNLTRYQFCDLKEDFNRLASFDLFISSRLHTPMITLQYGIPSLSFFSEKKTSLFFNNFNLQAYSITHSQIHQFWSLMKNPGRLSNLIQMYTFPGINELTEQSSGHLEALTRFLGL